jgi:hypothetical protein
MRIIGMNRINKMPAIVSRVPVELLHRATTIFTEGNYDDPQEALPALSEIASPDQLLAVSHRLRAFINLVHTSVEIPFWIRRAPDGSVSVHQALFEAAATAALTTSERPDGLAFDMKELIGVGFRLLEPVGRA